MLQKWKLDEEPELVVRSAEEERAVPRYKRKHGKQAPSRPQPRPSVYVGVLLTSCQTVDSSHLFGSPDLDKIFFARCVQTSQWHTKKLEEGLPQGVAQICVVKECVSEDQPLWLFPIGISQIPLAHASYSKPLPN